MNLDPLNLSVNTGEGRNIADAWSGLLCRAHFKRFVIHIRRKEVTKWRKSLSSSQYGIHFNYLADCCHSLENTCLYFTRTCCCISALAADAQVLLSHSVTTLNEAVLGLVIASVLSLLLPWQWIIGSFRNVFYPLLVISQMLPIMVLGHYLPYGLVSVCFQSDPCCLDKLFSDRSFFSDTLRKVSKEQIIFWKRWGQIQGRFIEYKIPAGLSGFFPV